MNKEKIIIISGPTAVGKTALSIELAKKFNGEIINADSIQIYKGLNIGSAKITEEEKEGIKHHLLDFLSPFDSFSAGDYAKAAKTVISDIISRKKTPIIVGGTGMYITSLLFDIGATCGKDENYRNKLELFIKQNSLEALYNQLKEIDPESAEKIHPNQKDRIMRALEIYHLTGNKKSEMKNSTESNYNYLLFGLYDDREIVYDRINKRVDKMINDGLLDEVQNLINLGVTLDNQCAKAIGYKEPYEYLTQNISKTEFLEKLKQNTRNYAKRQITYLKKIPNIIWKKYSEKEEIYKITEEFING